MLDDVGHVPQRQHVIDANGMLPGVKRHQITVNVILRTTGELRFVIRLERDDVESVAVNRNRPRVLSGNPEPLAHFACSHVDNGDLVFR